jgi:hypothetical protein
MFIGTTRIEKLQMHCCKEELYVCKGGNFRVEASKNVFDFVSFD